jgi:hypothetical protein
MKRLALLALLVVAAPALAQTSPAPASPPPAQDAPPKPRAPLKLNLNDVDPPRPRITFEPRDGQKHDPVKSLPGMGDAPATGSWERPSSDVFPADTAPGR